MRQGETACAYCGAVFETSQPMVVNIYNQEKQAEKEPEIRERVVYVERPAPAVSRKSAVYRWFCACCWGSLARTSSTSGGTAWGFCICFLTDCLASAFWWICCA